MNDLYKKLTKFITDKYYKSILCIFKNKNLIETKYETYNNSYTEDTLIIEGRRLINHYKSKYI